MKITITNDLNLIAVFKEDISQELTSLKTKIDDFAFENEMNYKDANELYDMYKNILGRYNQEDVLL